MEIKHEEKNKKVRGAGVRKRHFAQLHFCPLFAIFLFLTKTVEVRACNWDTVNLGTPL